jgi:cephalosporin hydroxylase
MSQPASGRPEGQRKPSTKVPDRPVEEIVSDFHKIYFVNAKRTFRDTYWFGTATAKCPLDMWVYQEIVAERRPDLIVECGTFFGGTAHFLACMCDMAGNGRVITIDVRERQPRRRPQHERLEYRTGSSTDPDVVAGVREEIQPGNRVMVILDSDHRKFHVLEELQAYAPLVTPGDYLIVEDTNINDHPVWPDFGPGPMEAVDEFMEGNDDFVIDDTREKYFMTFNPRGYLRRKE